MAKGMKEIARSTFINNVFSVAHNMGVNKVTLSPQGRVKPTDLVDEAQKRGFSHFVDGDTVLIGRLRQQG